MKLSLALDASQLYLLSWCPEKWINRYVKKIQRKGVDKKALGKGSVMHGLLERYYRQRALNESIQKSQDYSMQMMIQDKDKFSITPEEFQFLLMRFAQYVSFYNSRDFIPLVIEGEPQIEKGFSIELVNNELFYFVLEGRIDLIARSGDIIFVVDHKSQGRKDNLYPLGIQPLTYSLVTGVPRFMYNYIGLQQSFKDDILRRKLHYYGPQILEQWNHKVITLFYTAANILLMNIHEKRESSCAGIWGSENRCCEYSQICRENTDPAVINALIARDYETTTEWSPWTENE